MMETGVDGGWAWVIVLASFFNHFFHEGMLRSFGVIFRELVKRFHSSAAATVWIPTLFNVLTMCLGPLASILVERFGYRRVVMVGGLLEALAMLISAFTPNLYFLYFSIGIMAGTGGGLIFLPVMSVVTLHFDKKLGKAIGIAMLGTSVGTAVMSQFIALLLEVYAYQGAMVILSAVVLNHCVCAALYGPFKPSKLKSSEAQISNEHHENDMYSDAQSASLCTLNKKEETMDNGYSSYRGSRTSLRSRDAGERWANNVVNPQEYESCLPAENDHSIDRTDPAGESTSAEHSKIVHNGFNNLSDEACTTQSHIVKEVGQKGLADNTPQRDNLQSPECGYFWDKFHIFKIRIYCLFCFQTFTMPCGIFSAFVFFPSLAEERGLSGGHLGLPLMFMALGGAIGRVLSGVVFDFEVIRMRRRLFHALSGVLLGVIVVLLGVVPWELTGYIIMACCYGVTEGTMSAQRVNALSQYVDQEDLPLALGWSVFFQGFGGIIGPTSLGLAKDLLGSYMFCYLFGGCVIGTSSAFLVVSWTVDTLTTQRRPI